MLDFGVIDILIILVFVCVCVFFAFKTRGKVGNFEDYASGRQTTYQDRTIIATLTATLCSASLLWNGIEQAFIQGFFAIYDFLVVTIIGLLLMIFVFTPQIFKIRSITLQEHLGYYYGKYIRAIVSLVESMNHICLFVMQLKILGAAVEIIYGCEPWFSNFVIFFSAALLMLYSAYGGLKAVSVTDVCQFLFFFIAVPAIALYLWYIIGPEGHHKFFSLFDGHVEKMTFKGTFNSVETYVAAFASLFCGIFDKLASLTYFQRISMNSSVTLAKRTLGITTFIYPLLVVVILFIGLQLYAVSDGAINGATEIANGDAIKYLVSFLTISPVRTLFFIGLLALSISTSDSSFNCVSVLIANDVLPAFGLKSTKKRAVMSGVLLCSIGLIIALNIENLYELLIIGKSFYLPISAVPIALLICGFKTHRNAVWCGMVCGLLMTIIYPRLLPAGSPYAMWAFGPGMVANFIGIMACHIYYTKVKNWHNTTPGPNYTCCNQDRKVTSKPFANDKEFNQKYKEVMIEKMKRTVRQYEEENAKNEKEHQEKLDRIRNVIRRNEKEKIK